MDRFGAYSYIPCKEALCHLNAARSAGISSMIRVTQDDLTVTKKILEIGPDSILFPMVRSAKEVNKLIDMTLYPPYGTRGFGPIRAFRYGADESVIEFWAKFNPDILVAGADWNYIYQTGCDTLKKIKKYLDK